MITVVLPEWKPRGLLQEAVRSILGSDLPRDHYEVLVVKNQPEPDTDAWLASVGARVVQVPTESMTGPKGGLWWKMAKGLDEARGEVVCFLEDDDQFYPSKLRVVEEAFRDPHLDYLHHGMDLYTDGKLVGPREARAEDDHNNSSVAVRRSSIMPLVPAMYDIDCCIIDLYMHLGTIAMGRNCRHIPDRLTKFNWHEAIPGYHVKLTHLTQCSFKVEQAVRAVATGPRGREAVATALRFYYVMLVKNRTDERSHIAKAVLDTIWSASPTSLRVNSKEVLCGSLQAFSRGLASVSYRSLERLTGVTS